VTTFTAVQSKEDFWIAKISFHFLLAKFLFIEFGESFGRQLFTARYAAHFCYVGAQVVIGKLHPTFTDITDIIDTTIY